MDRFRWLNRLRAGRAGLLALLLGASLTGCGARMGEVRGTVRCDGKPLPFGTIQFLGQDGLPYAGTIQADGTFSVQVPVGEAKVLVRCVDEDRLSHYTAQAAGSHGRAAPPPLPRGGFSLIPQRYADWDSSGLTVRVQPGTTEQDFSVNPN
jgi:hypothetical protein